MRKIEGRWRRKFDPFKTSMHEVIPGYYAQVPQLCMATGVVAENHELVIKIAPRALRGIRVEAFTILSLDGSNISSSEWRGVAPYDIWEEIAPSLLWKEVDSGPAEVTVNSPDNSEKFYNRYTGESSDYVAQLRAQGGSSEETLKFVARVYGLAEGLSVSPNKFVQEAFAANGALDPLPRATASKWIRAARDKGLMVDFSQDSVSEKEMNSRRDQLLSGLLKA